MKASKIPWFGWLLIAAAFAIGGAATFWLADYINHIPGKWGSGDFLANWVAPIFLVIGGLLAITGLIRFLKWTWTD